MKADIKENDRVLASREPGLLTSEEGYLWSRIGNGIQVKELLSLSPWPKDQSLELLKSLIAKQSAQVEQPNPERPQKVEKQKIKLQAFLSDQQLEQIENRLHHDKANLTLCENLPEAFRREVLVRQAIEENINPFDLLECAINATPTQIQSKYHELSRKFHPDRFFRKEMGDYNKALNKVFTALQKAYDKIKHPFDREAVIKKIRLEERKKTNTPSTSPAGKNPSQQKLPPELEKVGKAEHHYKLGCEARDQKRYLEAANHFVMASQLNPNKSEYDKAHRAIAPFIAREKAHHLFDEATRAIEVGMYEDALLYAEQSLKSNPDFTDAATLAAKCILDLGLKDRFDDALQLLKRAKVKNLRDADACFHLGRLFQAQFQDDKACLELEEALRRNPHLKKAKKLLEKLKQS